MKMLWPTDVNYDRSAVRRSIIPLMLVFAASLQAQDLLAPLPIRDQFLLNNGFFFFEPADARVLADNDLRITFNGAEANTFAKSSWISTNLAGEKGRADAGTELENSRFQGEGPLFLADGETHRFELTFQRGFGNHIELGLTVPVSRIGGGWSDNLVEAIHHALGVGNAGRDTLRQNSETVYLQTATAHYFRDRSAGYALGDIALTGKYELTALEDKHIAMALAGAIQLPTGNARSLAGSGSIDAGVEMMVSRELGRSRIHASVGFVRLGADRVVGTPAQIVTTSTIAVSHMINDRASATIQLTMSESPFRYAGLAELTRRSNQLSAGFQRQIGRSMIAYVALIENLLNYENSADAALAWGVTRRF
jgi:hypothetical protein